MNRWIPRHSLEIPGEDFHSLQWVWTPKNLQSVWSSDFLCSSDVHGDREAKNYTSREICHGVWCPMKNHSLGLSAIIELCRRQRARDFCTKHHLREHLSHEIPIGTEERKECAACCREVATAFARCVNHCLDLFWVWRDLVGGRRVVSGGDRGGC